MEKKNTILLTVIAVATLLVAVVGATFAYYSLTVQHATGTVNVGVQADEPGKIALTSKGGDLHMKLLPADMANFKEVRDYYATSDGSLTQIQQQTEIAKVSLTDGAQNTEYKCTSTVEVTLKNEEGTMGNVLRQGDAAFVLTSNSDGVLIGGQKQISLDLSELKDENTEEYIVTYTLGSTGTNKKTEESLYADLKITNRQDDQSYLAGFTNDGKELNVTVKTTQFNCEIAKIS